MFLTVDGSPHDPRPVVLRCPKCRHVGTFEPMRSQNVKDVVANTPAGGNKHFFVGHRRCPNETCHLHVFVILDHTLKMVRAYPAERIDFDTKDVPATLVKTFTEALSCYAEELYVAAAIMIRRTLEELCLDKAAGGKDLKARIAALGQSVVMPLELLSALDDLRLLGNDAAHVEAKTYDTVGKEEIEVAIDVTKEILKAVYQYGSLVSRLKALKK